MDATLSNIDLQRSNYDVDAIRADFPILASEFNGYPLTFLDSGASAQKPECVLRRMDDVYRRSYANVHRGAYALSQAATDYYEGARKTVARYLNARSDDEIVFTHNVTAAINLVAHSYGRRFMERGDEVIISQMEHHANIVPWQLICKNKKLKIKVIDPNRNSTKTFHYLICKI